MATTPTTEIVLTPKQVKKLKSREWRLSHLYQITNEQGKVVRFAPNWAQKKLLEEGHDLNIILKARQLGFTTFITIFALDCCIFQENFRAGIIAHNLEDAKKIFRDKIKFAYDRMPAEIKALVPAETDRAGELLFGNNSAISVATSFRSGTLQLLHISEFGKICCEHPGRAREIVTGAFQAVQAGQRIYIESTSEGRGGYFYDYCERAKHLMEQGKQLTPLDFKFFFFPWYEAPKYRIDTEGVPISPQFHEYFDKLRDKHGIALDAEQQAWYIKKWELLGEDITQEFPSTPEEAFQASIKGAYFTKQMSDARKDGRICSVPVDQSVLVDTYWDLGINDQMTIWFVQQVGYEIHLIDYFEASGEGFGYYKDLLDEREYRYGSHYAPHDISARELTTGVSRLISAKNLGISFEVITRCASKLDSIDAARTIFSRCWFDEDKCSLGLQRLENYRKKWDKNLGVYLKEPLHDENSNGADAFQGMAMGIPQIMRMSQSSARPVRVVSAKGWA